MMIKRYIIGIVLAVLMLSVVSFSVEALIEQSASPSETEVPDTVGDPQTFTLNVNENANFSWYINGSTISPSEITETENVTTSSYSNGSAKLGYWNITVIAVVFNGTDNINHTWWWNVTAASPPGDTNTTPAFTAGPSTTNINDTSAKITFEVNQSNAITYVIYSNKSDLSGFIKTENQTSETSRTVNLADLTKGTPYYYSVFAYNGTNQSLFTNSSPVSSFTTLNPNVPNVTSVSMDPPTSSSVNITFSVNQTDAITKIKYGKTDTLELGFTGNGTGSRTVRLSPLDSSTKYYFSIFAYNLTNQSYSSNSSIQNFTTKFPAPTITYFSPTDTTPDITDGQSQLFWVKADQNVTVRWYKDSSEISDAAKTVDPNIEANYTFTGSVGNYTITANASNVNGSDTQSWIISVHPKTYYSGDRIWDERKHSRTYTWDVYSFSGFYYNLDDNLGNESLTITNIGRSLKEDDITYSTSPDEVEFAHSDFGRYEVIGFMADKYFAGYTTGSKPSGDKTKSTIGSSQLHKVLLDDDDKRTVSEGGTLTLKDGYVLKVTAVDIGAGTGQVWITLLKDGVEVDSDVVAGKDDYYYTKKVGSVSDLPVIAVHFDSVFRGREVNAVFIKGAFQISESYTQVKSGSKYGVMEVDSATSNIITMKNDNTVDLSAGNTIDLMGNLKIKVADNSSILRFGLTVETTGTFEARGTIYNRTDEWTPMNFGMNIGGTSIGFYYDMDEDIGNETLWIEQDLTGRTSISESKLKYSTNPQEVSFEHDNFGSYQVIGFMADKYFAGYTAKSEPSGKNAKSTIGSSQLHKVLLDDDEKRTVSEGGTLTLKEGYVLKITAVDIGAGQGQVWITLLKDGSEVDSDVVAGNDDYYYSPDKVGSVSDLPVIAVHFDSVFRGREVNAVFIRGVFQISESYTQVKSGSKYGAMEVTGASSSGITMENDNTIDLSPGSTSDVMGNIKFRVADSGDLRFYPFVMVTSEMLANQLVIDAPAKVMAGDNITIKVNAGGNLVDNASISLDSDIGNTDKNGILNYTLPKTLKGMYNITATKLGYEKAVKTIEIEKYIDLRLSLDIPAKANQFETLTILVKYNSTVMGGATVKYDNETIGSTDSNGALNYTPQTSGMHTISASKSGYITVIRDIEVIAPFSEYKALDINITPAFVYPSQKVVIRSNITNAGTKADTLPVDLIINGSVVGNRSVALGPHETKEINFTGNLKEWMMEEVKPGNYTVEIQGQKTTMPVQEEPLNLFLVAGIITILGAVLIFIMTSKEILSIEALKAKLKMGPATGKAIINRAAIDETINSLRSKLDKAINNLRSMFQKK